MSNMVTSKWSAYWPDDGETADDAMMLKHYSWKKIYDDDDAARLACEIDYSEREGWERIGEGNSFKVVIISPDGDESEFECFHEPTVEHFAYRVDQ